MKLIMENWKRYLNEQSPAGFYGDLPKKDQERIGKAQQAMLDARKAKLSDADAETIRTMVSLFDPTAISAYPDIPPAVREFEQDPTYYNGAMLTLALAAAIPILGKAATALKAIVAARKINKSVKSAKGAQKFANDIGATLDELPSPQEIKRRKREYLRNKAAGQLQSKKPSAGRFPVDPDVERYLTNPPMRPAPRNVDKGYHDVRAIPDEFTQSPVIWTSHGGPAQHEWLSYSGGYDAINTSISLRLRKKFEDAQVYIRKQVADRSKTDRSKTVNQRAATQNIKKPGPLINSPTLRNPRTEPLTVQGGSRTVSSPPPIPKKKK